MNIKCKDEKLQWTDNLLLGLSLSFCCYGRLHAIDLLMLITVLVLVKFNSASMKSETQTGNGNLVFLEWRAVSATFNYGI